MEKIEYYKLSKNELHELESMNEMLMEISGRLQDIALVDDYGNPLDQNEIDSDDLFDFENQKMRYYQNEFGCFVRMMEQIRCVLNKIQYPHSYLNTSERLPYIDELFGKGNPITVTDFELGK